MPFINSARGSFGPQRFGGITIPPYLYEFTTATFTSGGATGQNGPNITQARSGVGNPSWASTYLNMTTNGKQRWTVPQTGSYQFIVRGSVGGNTSARSAGSGAVITFTTTLTEGGVLELGVGQRGQPTEDNQGSGGGGASWVFNTNTSTLLCVAGGGGGAGNTQNGVSAVNSQNGGSGTSDGGPINNGGTNGNAGGGGSNTCSWPGAGWLSSGSSLSGCNRFGGSSAIRMQDSAIGGLGENGLGAGGFGGGGGGANNNGYGGGGGGYSGGGPGGYNGGGGGGGGGSFCFTTYSFSTNSSDGSITVTRVS